MLPHTCDMVIYSVPGEWFGKDFHSSKMLWNLLKQSATLMWNTFWWCLLSTWNSRGKHDIHLFQLSKSATADNHRCFQKSSVLFRTVEYVDCLVSEVSLWWSWNPITNILQQFKHSYSSTFQVTQHWTRSAARWVTALCYWHFQAKKYLVMSIIGWVLRYVQVKPVYIYFSCFMPHITGVPDDADRHPSECQNFILNQCGWSQ
jgi:hypothetical protein